MAKSTMTFVNTALFSMIAAAVSLPAFAAGGEGGVSIGPKDIATGVVNLVIFLIVLAVLAKFVWAPITSALAQRQEKIEGAIKSADEARAKADAMLKQYEAKLTSADSEVRNIIARAAADAENISTNIRTKAQQDAEEIRERAEREIELAKTAALREIYAQAAEISTNIAEKIIRRNLNVDDQRNLVNDSLGQLQAANKN